MPVLKFKKTDGTWQSVLGSLGSTPKLATIVMPTSGWQGSSSPYSQVISCNHVSVNSKLDLQPTPDQITELQDTEISLMVVNNNGVATVYAIGDKPTSDMTMQMLITEVAIV